MDSDVRRLRCFLTVADELHFGRAAARLGVTTSAVTQQVNRLERDLGQLLFWRTSRTVRLSPDGAGLLPLARDVVSANDRLADWVTRGPVLTFGVTATAPGVLMQPILDGLAEAIEVEPAVRRLDHRNALRALERREVAAVFTRDPVGSAAGHRTLPLYHEGRVAVLAEGHPLAGRHRVVLAELSSETVLVMEGGSAEGDFADLRERCATGAGVGIAPASARRLHPDPRLRFVPITDVAPSRVVLCTGADGGSPAVKALEDVSRRVAAAATRAR